MDKQRMTEIDAMARGMIGAINNREDALSLSLAIRCILENDNPSSMNALYQEMRAKYNNKFYPYFTPDNCPKDFIEFLLEEISWDRAFYRHAYGRCKLLELENDNLIGLLNIKKDQK